MQRVIILRRSSTGWTATSEAYRPLFGTDTLPTAFTPDAPAEHVWATIQGTNPDALVRVER